MKADSIYSISFYSNMLNNNKYCLLQDKAHLIRDFKNMLSEKICKDPLTIINTTKEGLTKIFNTQIKGLVGREIQPAIRDVYTKYDNRIKSFKNRIKCKIQKGYVLEYYKRNTKNNKKNDVKTFYIKKIKTPLTRAVEHLTKKYYPGYIDYMIDILNKGIDNKTYKNALYYINKYNDRLIELCIDKQKRVCKMAFNCPILFKSVTYSAINNLKLIVDENPNKDSCISHHILLSGFKGITKNDKLILPIRYNKDYHEDIKEFNKNQPTYTVQFVKDKVRIILTKKGERCYKNVNDNCGNDNILGMDGNVKHNIFSMSDNEIIDFDRDMVKKYVQLQLKMDKKADFLYKTNDKDLTTEEYKQKHRLIKRNVRFLRKLDAHYKYLVYKLIKHAKDNEYDHIAIEDLLFNDKMFSKSEEFFNIKFSRLIKMLRLSNFKNILATQCSNKDIQLSIVNPAYTSQRCSNKKCGYVHKDNRKTQEEFECIKCGYKTSADYNAARNIKQITEIEVLNRSLLTYDKITGWLVPKKLTRQKIKKILDDYHYDSCLEQYVN